MIEIGTGTLLTVGLIFTVCCVYFNWKSGFREGFVQGGSYFYDVAVKDTISYLVESEQLAPHLKHQVNNLLIESIARQGAKDRGYINQEEKSNV